MPECAIRYLHKSNEMSSLVRLCQLWVPATSQNWETKVPTANTYANEIEGPLAYEQINLMSSTNEAPASNLFGHVEVIFEGDNTFPSSKRSLNGLDTELEFCFHLHREWVAFRGRHVQRPDCILDTADWSDDLLSLIATTHSKLYSPLDSSIVCTHTRTCIITPNNRLTHHRIPVA